MLIFLPSLKLTASLPLKMDGWNTTFLSYWLSAYFQGRKSENHPPSPRLVSYQGLAVNPKRANRGASLSKAVNGEKLKGFHILTQDPDAPWDCNFYLHLPYTVFMANVGKYPIHGAYG